MNSITSSRKALPAAIALALAIPVETLAQDVLEEVIVTASRREESLLDAPLAVTAISGDELAQRGVIDSNGIGDFVPNLTIGTEGARDATYIAIRGVSQNERRNTDDATTPFFVDGATIPRMSGVAAYFYDVERLEVLRGPQGTLYGRNSTTGVVNLITNKPNFEEYGGNVELGIGNFNSTNLTGAFNMPFTDTFAARVAFIYQERDGYFENGPLVENSGDADDLGIRAHLLWNLSDSTSLLLTADTYQKQGVGNNSLGVPCTPDVTCALGLNLTNNEGDTPVPVQSFRDNEDTNFKVELNHSFENFDLMALVSQRVHERDYRTADPFDELLNGVQIDGVVDEVTESDSLSAELRFTSTGSGPLQWIAGFYYLDEEINGEFHLQRPFVGSPNIGNTFSLRFVDQGLTIESQAIFANVSYALSDTVTARVGARYTDDEKNKGGIADPSNPGAGSFMAVSILETGAPLGPPIRAQVANPTWSETTYEAGLDFNVSDDSLFYVKFSTGYKAGGFNRGSAEAGSAPPIFLLNIYDPEEVNAYEVGYKTSFANGRGRLNISAFMNDYQNKVESVVTEINGVTTNTAVNATDVDISGIEFELSTLLGDSGGRLDVSLGLLNAEYGSFTNLPDPIFGGVLDVSGTDVLNAPNRTMSVSWVPTVWSFANGSLTPRIQIAYKSDYNTRPHGLQIDRQDAYTRSNLSLMWESNSTDWYGEIFVRNIEDEIVQTASGCGVNGSGVPSFAAIGCEKMFAAPRTVGLRAGFRF